MPPPPRASLCFLAGANPIWDCTHALSHLGVNNREDCFFFICCVCTGTSLLKSFLVLRCGPELPSDLHNSTILDSTLAEAHKRPLGEYEMLIEPRPPEKKKTVRPDDEMSGRAKHAEKSVWFTSERPQLTVLTQDRNFPPELSAAQSSQLKEKEEKKTQISSSSLLYVCCSHFII